MNKYQQSPDPPPIVTKPFRRYRPKHKVLRPIAINIVLFLIWVTMTIGGIFRAFWLTLIGGAISIIAGVDPSTFEAWFLLSFIISPTVSFAFVWFLGWLFDSMTEYRVQIVAEGTARALDEDRNHPEDIAW